MDPQPAVRLDVEYIVASRFVSSARDADGWRQRGVPRQGAPRLVHCTTKIATRLSLSFPTGATSAAAGRVSFVLGLQGPSRALTLLVHQDSPPCTVHRTPCGVDASDALALAVSPKLSQRRPP